MFQTHSLLWHYLWITPNVLLLFLAFIAYRRSLHQEFPVFFLFMVIESVTALGLYAIEIVPFFSAAFYWDALVRLLVEVVLKFALIAEIFSRLCKPYAVLSKLGQVMIQGVGAALVLVVVSATAWTRPSGGFHPLIATSHRLTLGDFVIECGLLLFIFLFAAYFHLPWDRLAFGIALGRGFAASVQLGTWALMSYLVLSQYEREDMGLY